MLANNELFTVFQKELEENILFETNMLFDEKLVEMAMADFASSADYHEYNTKPPYEEVRKNFRRQCLVELKKMENCLEKNTIPTKLKKRVINIYLRLIEFYQPIVFYNTSSQLFTWKISISKSSNGVLLKYQNTFDHTDKWIERFTSGIVEINTHSLEERKDNAKFFLKSFPLLSKYDFDINVVDREILHLMAKISCLSEQIAYQTHKLRENRFYISLFFRVRA